MTTSTGLAGAGSAERSEGGMGGGLLGATVMILVLEPLLMFTAFFVLNSSIDWPASLDAPARVNLPLILEQQGAVTLGYGAYLAYSLLVLPLSVMFYFLLKERGSSSPLLAAVLLLPGLFSVVGIDVGTLFAVIGGNVLLVWMLALAVVLIRHSRRTA